MRGDYPPSVSRKKMPIRRTILVFANPNAGRGRARSFAGKIAGRLHHDGYLVRTVFEPPGYFLPKEDEHYHAAIVMGGDGTMRARRSEAI